MGDKNPKKMKKKKQETTKSTGIKEMAVLQDTETAKKAKKSK